MSDSSEDTREGLQYGVAYKAKFNGNTVVVKHLGSERRRLLCFVGC